MKRFFLIWIIILLFAFPCISRPSYQYGDFQTFFAIRTVYDMAISQNYIYFLAQNGILRYDWMFDEWKLPYSNFDILIDHPPIALAIDTLWDDILIRTEFGAYRVSEASLGSMPPMSYIPDGVEWGTGCDYNFEHIVPPFGLFYDMQRDAFIGRNFVRYPITCCIQDNEDVFIGTEGGGIFLLDDFSKMTERVHIGLGSDFAQQIHINDDYIFFGGVPIYVNESSAITKWDRAESWEWVMADTTSRLINADVTGFVTYDDLLFAGTEKGVAILEQYDLHIEKFIKNTTGLLGDKVNAIEIFDSMVFVGTDMGLTSIHPISLRTQKLTKPIFGHISYLDASPGSLWIGTDDELFIYTQETGVKFHPTTDNVTGEYIDAIAFDPIDSTMWFASRYGIVRSDSNLVYTSADYGKHLRFYCITPTLRYLWFGTNKGVLRYRREDRTWLWYEASDGIASNQIHSIVEDGDYIWFGTPKGATRFLWNVPHRMEY